MANLIFRQVKQYAGLKHWPTALINMAEGRPVETPKIEIKGALRGTKGIMPADEGDAQLPIVYNPNQLRDSEVIIADFAHVLAHYLASTSQEPPPGGQENWPHITEVVAVFMGFGLMMANSAHTVKIRSCGSCSGPAVERSNALSQYDITYALAIFSCLKDGEDTFLRQLLGPGSGAQQCLIAIRYNLCIGNFQLPEGSPHEGCPGAFEKIFAAFL
jgi:hypothetical protein